MFWTIVAIVSAVYAVSCGLSWCFHARYAPQVLRIVQKEGPWWFILWLVYRPLGNLDDNYTTIANVCGVPRGLSLDIPDSKRRHETTHANQYAAFGWGHPVVGLPFFAVLYFVLPLPVGLAFFRWRAEREAYIAGGTAPERIVELVCGRRYGWSWPKSWARKSLGLP